MKIKYEVDSWLPAPKRVEVERETEKSVWIKGYGQCRKNSDVRHFYDTFEEAKNAMIEQWKRHIHYHESIIKIIESKINRLMELQE